MNSVIFKLLHTKIHAFERLESGMTVGGLAVLILQVYLKKISQGTLSEAGEGERQQQLVTDRVAPRGGF